MYIYSCYCCGVCYNSFAGCSDNGAPQASTGSEGVASQTSDDASAVSQTKQPAKKRETIKIDDIAWNVDQGIVDGEKYVLLDYTNNSKYTVTDFEMTFKEKGSVTEEDKENFYNEIKDKFSMSDDDISELKQRDISMHAETEKIVEPGESAKNINCYYYSGIYYLKDINHFNLVEPDVATINTLMTIKSTLHIMISALKNIQKMKIPKRHIIGPHRNSAQKFLSLM